MIVENCILKRLTIENSNQFKSVTRYGIYMHYIYLKREEKNTVNYLKDQYFSRNTVLRIILRYAWPNPVSLAVKRVTPKINCVCVLKNKRFYS